MTSDDLSSVTRRRYALLNALDAMKEPTLEDLQTETGIPATTIRRLMGSLRQELGIDLRYTHPVSHRQGATGYYEIRDWGVIDREAFRSRFGHLGNDTVHKEGECDAR